MARTKLINTCFLLSNGHSWLLDGLLWAAISGVNNVDTWRHASKGVLDQVNISALIYWQPSLVDPWSCDHQLDLLPWSPTSPVLTSFWSQELERIWESVGVLCVMPECGTQSSCELVARGIFWSMDVVRYSILLAQGLRSCMSNEVGTWLSLMSSSLLLFFSSLCCLHPNPMSISSSYTSCKSFLSLSASLDPLSQQLYM
jgi:hypothetical protein